MPKKAEGSVITRTDRPGLWARVTYSDNLGRRRVIQRKVDNRTEGKLLLKKLLREIEERGAQILEGDRLTFHKLAEVYEEKRLFKPTITPSGKAIGLKSFDTLRRRLKTLQAYFGNKRIKAITHVDIEQFKRERLETTPARFTAKCAKLRATIAALEKKRPRKGFDPSAEIAQAQAELRKLTARIEAGQGNRSEADVNRDMQLLRNVFNFAVRQGWLAQNPFALGEPLISTAAEVRRERVLSREEEERLLMACAGPRAHLKPILICALDTAMRRGEMFKLCWADVDLVNREINIRARNTKTAKKRVVPISARLHSELLRLRAVAINDPETRVFGVSDIKKGFASICDVAGVEDFRLHDARHTAITRWIESGMPPMQVMAISGHTQMTTFARYVNADRVAVRRAGEAMDVFHMDREAQSKSDFVN